MPTVPSFYVDGSSEPLSYFASDVEAQGPCPDIPIPTTGREAVTPPVGSHLGEDAVNTTLSLAPTPSSTAPQLRHRQIVRDRTMSAPTLMEHEIGLALRSISDEFNEAYIQKQANQRRRASLPNMNNHHAHGFRGWWQQVGHSSWTSSSMPSETMAPEASSVQGSTEPSQRLSSANSIPEEDEEVVERESK